MEGILHTRTQIYVYICVFEKGSLKDKDTLNFNCHRNASLRPVALLLTRRFFCKCNAKNSDNHNASLHTKEECKGGRGSLLCNRVLVIAVLFVEDTFEWSIGQGYQNKSQREVPFLSQAPSFRSWWCFFFGTCLLDLSQMICVNFVQGFYQSDWLRFLKRGQMQDVNNNMFGFVFQKRGSSAEMEPG